MKKFISIFLVLTLCLTCFTACSKKSDKNKESETTAITIDVSTYKRSFYDFFNAHKKAMSTLVNNNFNNEFSDEMLVNFAVAEIIDRADKKLADGVITQDEYEMELLQIFPNDINAVTEEFFDCTADDYNSTYAEYDEESGALVPLDVNNFNDIKFILGNAVMQDEKTAELVFEYYVLDDKIENDYFYKNIKKFADKKKGLVKIVCVIKNNNLNNLSIQFIENCWFDE